MEQPKITFGMIVLNGEPFLRYNLRALYPYAHQIIVAEGASPLAASAASPDGHSTDGTLHLLRQFKQEEDPENKLTIVTAEDEGHPNGFWPGEKDEQSQAYARRATGDWLWQVDIDEFYQPDDMARLCDYLQLNPVVTCLTFNAHHFWGGFDYEATGGIYRSIRFQGEPGGAYRRVFRWGDGYRYKTHRPPTVLDDQGRDTARQMLHNVTRVLGIRMYHYSMVFPFQMSSKSAYYQNRGSVGKGMVARNNSLAKGVDLRSGIRLSRQFGTYNWLVRFQGIHPPAIQWLRRDINEGRLQVELRRVDDIEALLVNPQYLARIRWLNLLEQLRSYWHQAHYVVWAPVRRFLVLWIRRGYRHLSWLPLPASVKRKLVYGD
jgi:hypothetical protein